MVPIHDTDVASERWSKSEWEYYELWEKIEQRLKRRKWFWVGAAVAIFLAVSSIPVFVDRAPKWATLGAVRRLGQEINLLKRDAALDHLAYRIRFDGAGKLTYSIEKGATCAGPFQAARRGALEPPEKGTGASDYALYGNERGFVDTFCYDAYAGAAKSDALTGFGVIPVKDLAQGRLDRLSVLLLSGASGEVSFE